MKKKLLFLTILCFTLIMIFTACGDEDVGGSNVVIKEVDNLKLQLSSDGTCFTVIDVKDKSASAISIPEAYENVPVTAIGDKAFFGCTAVREIVIPSKVTTIGKQAFDCCASLYSITIPSGVKAIGDNAFDNCHKIVEVCNLSALEISERLGFCDQFYFSRRFKEKYGSSPREYRKKTNI